MLWESLNKFNKTRELMNEKPFSNRFKSLKKWHINVADTLNNHTINYQPFVKTLLETNYHVVSINMQYILSI